jgi:hypothetical protein
MALSKEQYTEQWVNFLQTALSRPHGSICLLFLNGFTAKRVDWDCKWIDSAVDWDEIAKLIREQDGKGTAIVICTEDPDGAGVKFLPNRADPPASVMRMIEAVYAESLKCRRGQN